MCDIKVLTVLNSTCLSYSKSFPGSSEPSESLSSFLFYFEKKELGMVTQGVYDCNATFKIPIK